MTATGEDFTLGRLVGRLAHRQPDRPALTAGRTTLDFAGLERRSSQVARAMAGAGVGHGDRVAVLARNRIEYLEVMLGASKLGAVLVGINVRLAAPEVAVIVADAAPRIVFVAEDLAGLVAGGPRVVVLGAGYEAWLAAAPDGAVPDPSTPDDIVLQLYSSGTTGAPKGAMLTNANLSWTPRMGRETYGMSGDSVNLLTSPLFHVGGAGYGLTTLGQGGHTVLAADMDPVHVLDLIETHAVTHAFLVPTVIRSLLDALATHPTDLSSLQLVAYGAAPIDDRTLRGAMDAFGCRFLGVYGMTETAGSVTALLPGDHDPGGPGSHRLRSVGRPLPWHEVRVVDPATGDEAATGVVGEIWVRSGQNMVGYSGQEAQTAATLRPDGWLRTGDAAWRDGDGYLYMHDRIKDMIISGGENVYPAEVERVLVTHPAVAEVAVVGVPHPRWGETVKAVVVARSEVTDAELIAFARDRLAHFKCPTSVDFVDHLERNASGKIQKRTIRRAYWPAAAASS